MIVCVAVDDKMGMTFNRRRQSKDALLRKKLLEISKGHRLYMNNYSAKQFENVSDYNIVVDDEMLDKACDDDFCFVENLPLKGYEQLINKMFIFRWNRLYPADMFFDISLDDNNWILDSAIEFEGNSHKNITMEEWIRYE